MQRTTGGLVVVLGVALVALVPRVAEGAAPGTVRGSIYTDVLGDGRRDGDDRAGGGPLCTAALDQTASGAAQTIPREDIGEDGSFTFASVEAGRHTVTVSCLYSTITTPSGGLTEVVHTTPATVAVDVRVGMTADLAFGVFVPPRLYGQVFRDDDRDGVKDDAEPGVDGCTVVLDDSVQATSGTEILADLRPVEHGTYEFAPGPGRHHLDASCPGLPVETIRPGDVVARSGEQLGAVAGRAGPNGAEPLWFGFAPARSGDGGPTTTGPGDATTTIALQSSSSSTSSTAPGGLATGNDAEDDDDDDRGVATAVGIGAVLLAAGALAAARLRSVV